MEYRKLSINDIELDLENPRIKQWLEIYKGEITGEGISLALSASNGPSATSTYTSLKESIKVNNGIINPIIVNRKKDGRMIVIEGNTRLQIYKEFAKVNPEGPWNTIIAMVYDDLEDERVHAIRLQTHLVGPRDWDAFSKAKYLNQLSNVDRLPLATIISFCGGKGSEIKKLISAYTDMLSYYFIAAEDVGIDPDPREFSKFSELQNKSITEALLIHNYSKEDFARWVVKGNIDNAQNVRKIPAILANEVAKEEFFKSNISEAIKYLSVDEKSSKALNNATMDDLVVELTNRIRNIEHKEVKSLKNDPRYEEKKDNILDLMYDLKDLVEDITGE